MSEQPVAATTEELEQRCGHECLERPDHDGPHFYGYRMGAHSYEGVKDERDEARDRVATLEALVRRFVDSAVLDGEELLSALMDLWDDAEALLDETETPS